MKTEQLVWTKDRGWHAQPQLGNAASFVLIFGGRTALLDPTVRGSLRTWYPTAHLIGCSTAGEICGTDVREDSVSATAVQLEKTTIRQVYTELTDISQSYSAGERIAQQLLGDGLCHVFLVSDGLHVNGTELAAGLTSCLPKGVALTGGLAGDGSAFEETVVIHEDTCRSKQITAIGFYGDSLRIGYGSLGGWDPFGPERKVTRSKGSRVYELDGQSALGLYRTYLGTYAGDLPASGLLFPLALKNPDGKVPIVRTLLAIDDAEHSITFAGDVPEGSTVRLMKANFERLIDGACDAASTARGALADGNAQLALLISCVGRRLVLKQRTEEEVEATQQVLGKQATLAGFYSYGELAPFTHGTPCELHNQTMTITAFREV